VDEKAHNYTHIKFVQCNYVCGVKEWVRQQEISYREDLGEVWSVECWKRLVGLKGGNSETGPQLIGEDNSEHYERKLHVSRPMNVVGHRSDAFDALAFTPVYGFIGLQSCTYSQEVARLMTELVILSVNWVCEFVSSSMTGYYNGRLDKEGQELSRWAG